MMYVNPAITQAGPATLYLPRLNVEGSKDNGKTLA